MSLSNILKDQVYNIEHVLLHPHVYVDTTKFGEICAKTKKYFKKQEPESAYFLKDCQVIRQFVTNFVSILIARK